MHEDKAKGVYVKGLSDFYVGNAEEVFEIMRQGGSSRAVSATSEWRSHEHFTATKLTATSRTQT